MLSRERSLPAADRSVPRDTPKPQGAKFSTEGSQRYQFGSYYRQQRGRPAPFRHLNANEYGHYHSAQSLRGLVAQAQHPLGKQAVWETIFAMNSMVPLAGASEFPAPGAGASQTGS